MLISILFIIRNSNGFVNNFDAIKSNVNTINYDKNKFELLFVVNGVGTNKKAEGPPMARVFYQQKNDRNTLIRGIAESYGNAIIIGDENMRINPNVLKILSDGPGGLFFYDYKQLAESYLYEGFTFKQKSAFIWKSLIAGNKK